MQRARCGMLGLDYKEGAVAEGSASEGTGDARLQRSLKLGQRLDAPKVLIVVCDATLRVPDGVGFGLSPEALGGSDTCVMPRSISRGISGRWQPRDPISATLAQVDAQIRCLHRSLVEDAEVVLGGAVVSRPGTIGSGTPAIGRARGVLTGTSPTFSDAAPPSPSGTHSGIAAARPESGNTLDSCLWALAQRECEALAKDNAALRSHQEEEQKRYEVEVARLRNVCRVAQQGASTEDASSMSAEASGRSPLGQKAARRRAALVEKQDLEVYLHSLVYDLHQQEATNARAEQQAYLAIQEKEKCVHLFSQCHEELSKMRANLCTARLRKEALEAEVAELELKRGRRGREAAPT